MLMLRVIGVLAEVAAISNSTIAEAGETVVLVCVGIGNPSITWSKDGQVLYNTSTLSIYEEDLLQGGRLFKQSFLQLCSLQPSDSGNYTCSVSNDFSSDSSSIDLTVTGKSVMDTSHSSVF